VLFYSSPTPEKAKSKKRKQAPADDSKAVPQESAAALEAADAHEQVDTDDAFHAAAGSLFRDWLTQHKAQLAEEEQVSPYNPSTLSRTLLPRKVIISKALPSSLLSCKQEMLQTGKDRRCGQCCSSRSIPRPSVSAQGAVGRGRGGMHSSYSPTWPIACPDHLQLLQD